MSITIQPTKIITVAQPAEKGHGQTSIEYVRVSLTNSGQGFDENDLDDLKIALHETAKCLTFEISINNPEDMGHNIIIGGNVLKRLYEVLSLGCPDFNLEITLRLWFYSLETLNDAETDFCKVHGFKRNNPTPNAAIRWGYSARCNDLARYMNSDGFRFKYEVEVNTKMYVPLAKILQPIGDLYKEICRSSQHYDFQLVSENKTVFPCHKDILGANSKPLADVMEIMQEREFRIVKLSEKSIEALLKYLYYDSIDAPASSPDILEDLLYAAFHLCIQPLAEAMFHIIIGRGNKFVPESQSEQLRDLITSMMGQQYNDNLAIRAEEALLADTHTHNDLIFFIVINSPLELNHPDFEISTTLPIRFHYNHPSVEEPEQFVFVKDIYKSLIERNHAEKANTGLTFNMCNREDGVSIQLKGVILETLLNAVLEENGSPSPTAGVYLTFRENDGECRKELHSELFWRQESECIGDRIKLQDISDCPGRSPEVVHSFQGELKQLDWMSISKMSSPLKVSVTVTLMIPGNHVVQFRCWPRAERHLLTTGKHFDLAFVSVTGKKHFCHRAVVCVRAEEIADKVPEYYEEVEGIKMIPTDMSDTAITILLEFLYYNKLYEALDSPLYAWTLLMTARDFRIPSLWAAVSRIIKYQNNDWFNLKHAFLLYDAALQHPEKKGSEEIKCRIVEFLAVNLSELETNSTFNMAFPTDDSKKLFKSILQEVQ